jgi:hypothetical protein
VQERLQRHGCWEPLWRLPALHSGVNTTSTPPFGTNAKML